MLRLMVPRVTVTFSVLSPPAFGPDTWIVHVGPLPLIVLEKTGEPLSNDRTIDHDPEPPEPVITTSLLPPLGIPTSWLGVAVTAKVATGSRCGEGEGHPPGEGPHVRCRVILTWWRRGR